MRARSEEKRSEKKKGKLEKPANHYKSPDDMPRRCRPGRIEGIRSYGTRLFRVLHQDFLAMALPESRFDGVFANASLFHVPSRELPRVLLELRKALKPRGVLFCSNPRGNNEEGFSDGRYSCFFDLDTWRNFVRAVGFFEVGHYYRPPGRPRHQQPWLATVWRKG